MARKVINVGDEVYAHDRTHQWQAEGIVVKVFPAGQVPEKEAWEYWWAKVYEEDKSPSRRIANPMDRIVIKTTGGVYKMAPVDEWGITVEVKRSIVQQDNYR